MDWDIGFHYPLWYLVSRPGQFSHFDSWTPMTDGQRSWVGYVHLGMSGESIDAPLFWSPIGMLLGVGSGAPRDQITSVQQRLREGPRRPQGLLDSRMQSVIKGNTGGLGTQVQRTHLEIWKCRNSTRQFRWFRIWVNSDTSLGEFQNHPITAHRGADSGTTGAG
jgi:hypothetical protein